jgi:hypothetical protein
LLLPSIHIAAMRCGQCAELVLPRSANKSSTSRKLISGGNRYPLLLIFFIPLATGPFDDPQSQRRRDNAFSNPVQEQGDQEKARQRHKCGS